MPASARLSFLNLPLLGLCAVYIVSGAFLGLSSQWIKYQGMGAVTGIPILSTYTSELLALFAGFQLRAEPFSCRRGGGGNVKQRTHRKQKTAAVVATKAPASWHPLMIPIAAVDVTALVVCNLGTQAGILLWTSGYSLITLLTAAWRRIFLKRRVDPMQWVGVVVILAGVVAESVWSLVNDIADEGNNTSSSSSVSLTAAGNATTTAAAAPAFGGSNLLALGLGVLSALLYSVSYVLGEWIQTPVPNSVHAPPKPLTILSFNGSVGFLLTVAYIMVFTIPNWAEGVAAPVNRSGGSPVAISWILLASGSSVLLHFWSFYSICATSSLHAGISKAVESALVFLFGDLFYCQAWPALNIPGSPLNCLNGPKAAAIAAYFLGIALYLWGQFRLTRRLGVKGHGHGGSDGGGGGGGDDDDDDPPRGSAGDGAGDGVVVGNGGCGGGAALQETLLNSVVRDGADDEGVR